MVVMVCVGVVGVRGEAVLRDNGYEDVVVTIGEDVPEDARIIDNIKVQTKNLFVCLFLFTVAYSKYGSVWRHSGLTFTKMALELDTQA